MTEKRFIIFPNNVVWDNQLGEVVCRCILDGVGDAENVCQRLNEQQAIIHRDETSIKTMMFNMKKLEEENEQLRKELNDFKPVMFQSIRGTVILYSKGNNNE